MTLSTICTILIIFSIIALIGWLAKSLLKFAVIAGFIYLAFHIGFIWGFDEINKIFHLDAFLKPEVHEKLSKEYQNLEEKRKEYGIVETEEIKKVVDESIHQAVNQAGDAYDSIDKEALMNDIKTKLDSYSKEDIEKAIKQAEEELKKLNDTSTKHSG